MSETGYTDERSAGSDEPQDGTDLISNTLREQVNFLLAGGKIEKVSNDSELDACLTLQKRAKEALRQLEVERTEKVKPLNDHVKEINNHFKMITEPIDTVVRNCSQVGGAYQIEKKRIADEAKRIADQAAELERKRLAQLESDRIAEEERLRNEAKQAEAAGNIELANEAHAIADLVAQDAVSAAIAAQDVKPVDVARVTTPQGVKADYVYSAELTDGRAVLRWIVENSEYGYFEGAALTKVLEAGLNKIAKIRRETFLVPGARKVETPYMR
jgi:hypothetical protein